MGPHEELRVLIDNWRDYLDERQTDDVTDPWDDWGPEPPKAGPYRLTIQFDTLTDLEARLTVDAIVGFVKRRTTAHDVVVTFDDAT